MLVLFGGCVVALAALVFWHPLQLEALAFFLLHSESPASEVLQTTVDQANDPTSLLANLWKSGRIPHRQFVLGYLNTASTTKPALVKTLEAIVLEATADPDITTREFAFAALARIKHPRLRPLALGQGVQRWHEWWSAHQAAYVAPFATTAPVARAAGLPAPNFTLDDPAGLPVRLTAFRGKSVLLAFWSPGAPASLDDASH